MRKQVVGQMESGGGSTASRSQGVGYAENGGDAKAVRNQGVGHAENEGDSEALRDPGVGYAENGEDSTAARNQGVGCAEKSDAAKAAGTRPPGGRAGSGGRGKEGSAGRGAPQQPGTANGPSNPTSRLEPPPLGGTLNLALRCCDQGRLQVRIHPPGLFHNTVEFWQWNAQKCVQLMSRKVK